MNRHVRRHGLDHRRGLQPQVILAAGSAAVPDAGEGGFICKRHGVARLDGDYGG